MTREKFIDFTKDHIIYLDGATGSNLVKAGMPSGVCPEQWILEHREVMLQLQKEYVQAGTNILYAPTFTANRVKLAEYHLEKNMSSMIWWRYPKKLQRTLRDIRSMWPEISP